MTSATPRIPSVGEPTTLLCIAGLPWRRPLQGWAAEVLRRFLELCSLPASEETAIAIAECYNHAALIELHLGNVDHARQLCRAHLEWHYRGWCLDHAAWRVRLAVQPWINQLRLDILEGRGAGVRTALHDLRLRSSDEGLRFGPFCVDPSSWRRLLRDSAFDEVISRIYIWDTARSLVKDRLWSEARRFSYDGLRYAPPDTAEPPVMEELKALAMHMQREYARAARAADRMSRDPGAYANVFVFRHGLALACLGRLDSGLARIQAAAEAEATTIARQGLTPPGIVLLYELAQTATRLGDGELGREIALVAHGAATLASDEVMIVRCCDVLAGVGDEDARSYWAAQAAEHRRGSLYACLRKRKRVVGPHSDAGRAAHEGPLFATLLGEAKAAA